MFQRLSRRERIVVAAGTGLSVLSLTIAYVLMPQIRRWSDREAQIALEAEQLARLRSVLAEEEAVREGLLALEEDWRQAEQRLLAGATVAVAGSNLQLILNRYAAESGMELVRVDAVGAAATSGRLEHVPARISVRGDIRGLVDLLARVQGGETLLALDEMRVSTSPGLGTEAELLTASIGLHGYYRAPDSGR